MYGASARERLGLTRPVAASRPGSRLTLCALKRVAAKAEHARYGATQGIRITLASGLYRAEAIDGRRAVIVQGLVTIEDRRGPASRKCHGTSRFGTLGFSSYRLPVAKWCTMPRSHPDRFDPSSAFFVVAQAWAWDKPLAFRSMY